MCLAGRTKLPLWFATTLFVTFSFLVSCFFLVSILIIVIPSIALFIQTFLRFLCRSFLFSVDLFRMVVVPSLFLIIVVLIVWIGSAHFSIFRVTLFEERSFTIFLLILNVRNTMTLLWRATRHVLTKLFLLHGKNLDVIIHLYRSLLLHVIIVLLFIIYGIPLVSATFPFIV